MAASAVIAVESETGFWPSRPATTTAPSTSAGRRSRSRVPVRTRRSCAGDADRDLPRARERAAAEEQPHVAGEVRELLRERRRDPRRDFAASRGSRALEVGPAPAERRATEQRPLGGDGLAAVARAEERELAERVARAEAAQRELRAAERRRPGEHDVEVLPRVAVAVDARLRRDLAQLERTRRAASRSAASSRARSGLSARAASGPPGCCGRAANAPPSRGGTLVPSNPPSLAAIRHPGARGSTGAYIVPRRDAAAKPIPTPRTPLQDAQDQALQVAGLRHPEEHGVVAPGPAPLEELHAAAGVVRGVEDERLERLLREVVAARGR